MTAPPPPRVLGRITPPVTAGRDLRCPHCLDEGFVCEDHPDMPWEGVWGTVEGHAEHNGVGMPCPRCCSDIPADGTVLIEVAFVPDWRRDHAPA